MNGMALAIVVAGILAAAGTTVRAGLRAGVPVLLDFLLAAGLLRLSSGLGWDDIASIALIVAIRLLVTFGLQAHPPEPAGLSATWRSQFRTIGAHPPRPAHRPPRSSG